MKFYVIEPRINETKFTYYTNFVKELCLNEDALVLSTPTDDWAEASSHDCIFLGLGFFELFDSFKVFPDVPSIRNSTAKKIAYIHKVKNKYEEKIRFCKSHVYIDRHWWSNWMHIWWSYDRVFTSKMDFLYLLLDGFGCYDRCPFFNIRIRKRH